MIFCAPYMLVFISIQYGGIQIMIWYLFVSFSSFFIGPTSFAPVIDVAIDIVERNNGQYHVLVIIADGQVLSISLFPLFPHVI